MENGRLARSAVRGRPASIRRSPLQAFTFLDRFFTCGWHSARYHLCKLEAILNQLPVLVCLMVFLTCPYALLAQRVGRGAGAARPSTGTSSPAPASTDVNSFSRAVALQASPDQLARFPQLTKSTDAARKEAQSLIQRAENSSKVDSSAYAQLSDAIDEARSANLQFVNTFSTSQQSGLKALIKKLSKADVDISKDSKALSQKLERSETNGKKVSAIAQKLDKALTDFQSEQIDIGKQMGIQPNGESQ